MENKLFQKTTNNNNQGKRHRNNANLNASLRAQSKFRLYGRNSGIEWEGAVDACVNYKTTSFLDNLLNAGFKLIRHFMHV